MKGLKICFLNVKKKHDDCFAYKKGKCVCLTDTNFGSKDCCFYKTREQAERDWEKYGKPEDYN